MVYTVYVYRRCGVFSNFCELAINGVSNHQYNFLRLLITSQNHKNSFLAKIPQLRFLVHAVNAHTCSTETTEIKGNRQPVYRVFPCQRHRRSISSTGRVLVYILTLGLALVGSTLYLSTQTVICSLQFAFLLYYKFVIVLDRDSSVVIDLAVCAQSINH